jgi:hypothetical protein
MFLVIILVGYRRFIGSDKVVLNNERRIVRLISVVNLNCRQVKVYLFSLLSELEIQLGNLVSRQCQESELLAMTFGASDNPKFAEVKARYHTDKTKGVDVPFVEYLFLSDLINVIAKKRLYNALVLVHDRSWGIVCREI